MVRRRAPFGVLLSFGLVLAGIAVLASGVQTDRELADLWANLRLFELRTILASETENTPTVVFYRGMAANAFNRPEESADFLNSLLQDIGDKLPRATLRDILAVLDDDYTRMFEYAKSAQVRDRLLPLIEPGLKPAEVSAFKSITRLWKAISSARPQTVDIPGDTEIVMTEKGEVPVRIGGQEVPLLPDTGSSLSMIVSSDAARLGLDVLDLPVEVGTSTGKTISARPCLVPELSLGGIRVRGAVFLVVPDEMLYFPEIRIQRRGVMGFPILDGLGELTFTRRGRFVVTSPPELRGEPNFFLVKTDPVVEASYEGRRLTFLLDTGAFRTELSARFFDAFSVEIMRRGTYMPAQIEGIGTETRTPVFLMSGLTFRMLGHDVSFLSPLPVLTKPTGASSDSFDGSLSLDVLANREALTIDYGTMRLSLR